MTHGKVIVIGAGIGGLTTAATLRRVGIDVEVYERARELRPAGGALALMCNAALALRRLQIEPPFEKDAPVLEELHFLTRQGKPIRTLRFKEIGERLGARSFGISRTALQQHLLAEAGDTPIHLAAAATGFRMDGDQVRVEFADGRSALGDVVIGADGINSVIRGQLAGVEPTREPGYICWLATPAFTHPKVTPAYGAHYWGRGERFGLADIGGGQVYWWGTKNMPASEARTWSGGKSDVLRVYQGWADEVRAVIEATPAADILAVPAQDRPFLNEWGRGPVTLLGDAAHPMLPSLGQGAAVAIEDAVVLAECLKAAPDLTSGLRAYERARRERTRLFVETAYSMSRMEQAESRYRVFVRNMFFRVVPTASLDRRNEAFLTFPGMVPSTTV